MTREERTVIEAFRAAGQPLPDWLVTSDGESARIAADVIARRDRLRARADLLRARL